MRKRVFIACLLPEALKEKIRKIQGQFQGLPLRVVPYNNLHLTLVFIGNVREDELVKIQEVVNQVASRFQPFEVCLKSLSPGPLPQRPRLIWLELEPSQSLSELYQSLEQALVRTPGTGYSQKETRPFKGHITLARFQRGVRRSFAPRSVSERFTIDTLAVMESLLRPKGAFYKAVKKFSLGNDRNPRNKT